MTQKATRNGGGPFITCPPAGERKGAGSTAPVPCMRPPRGNAQNAPRRGGVAFHYLPPGR